MPTFVKRSRIAAPADRVFAWHRTPDVLERLIPPWEPVTVEHQPARLAPGTQVQLRIQLGPVRVHWIAEHRDLEDRGPDGGRFTDVQVRGPFACWRHVHDVVPDGPGASVLEDRIVYRLPGGRLAELAAGWLVRRRLDRLFAFRHRVTAEAVIDD